MKRLLSILGAAAVLVTARPAAAQESEVLSLGLTAGGRAGLPSTPSPFLDRAGRLITGLGAGFAREGDLVIRPGTTTVLDGALGGRFALADWLSLSAGVGGAVADDSGLDQNALAVGRTKAGLTLITHPGRPWAAGGYADLLLIPLVGGVGLEGFGAEVGALGGFDFGRLEAQIPVRLTGALALTIDDLEIYRSPALAALERVAHAANGYKRLDLSLGLEVYLRTFELFVDYQQELAAFRSGLVLSELPGAVTPGLRWSPAPRISFELAARLAVRRAPAPPLPPAPFAHFEGRVVYAFDIFDAPELPEFGALEGRVTDRATGQPIAGAVIELVDADVGAVASLPPDGRFHAERIPPNAYPVRVERAGYQPAVVEAVIKTGERASIDLALDPLPPRSTLKGRVVDMEGAPVPATIRLSDADGISAVRVTHEYLLAMAPGRHRAEVEAPGYLSQARTFETRRDEQLCYDFVLRPAARKVVAEVKQGKIEIMERINFEFDKAIILPESFHVLDNVVSILLKNPGIKELEVQGHTDAVGGDAYNARLSQDRAYAVVDYLVSHGVEADRLRAIGYGRSKPLVKSKSEAGRARNRRVEFVILE